MLKLLDISHNRLRHLPSLDALSRLVALDVSGNQLDQLPPLQELRHLKLLCVLDNRLQTLSGISGLTGLEQLGCKGNPLREPPRRGPAQCDCCERNTSAVWCGSMSMPRAQS
ncbi:CCR4 [Symbiodinium pilosum]|uniref:CCR4 protein n=1 Tax=Symbiodinium pilosum TaxID=2952 RepID=A0A812P999_SYMPI|nr:CCR4 [Symbiodinium pilosum]